MLKLRLCSIDLFATLGLTVATLATLALAGCASKSLGPDGGPPGNDAGADHSAVSQCQCTADTQALTVDWDCYCALHDCTTSEQQFGCQTGIGTWTHGCGFDEFTIDTAGGPEIWVFDQTGKQVGAQAASDTSPYVCPTNSGLQRFLLRAGQFRPDTCDGVTSCGCADAGTGPCQPR
jgi:hypothetical protein